MCLRIFRRLEREAHDAPQQQALRLTEMSGAAQIDTTLVSEQVSMPACEAVLRLLDLPRPVFLDNSLGDGRAVRYSYLTADPFLVIRSRGRRVEVTDPDGQTVLEDDPFETLRYLLSGYHVEPLPHLPPFVGGAVGYFGYDLGRLLERLPEINSPDESLPEMDIGLYDWALATDHLTGENWLMATGLPIGDQASARRRIAAVRERLTGPPVEQKKSGSRSVLGLRSNFSRDEYIEVVRQVKEYIAAGDVYQVNLSHRLEGERSGSVWPLYERLRAASPAPHGAYLDLGDVAILSASPERFLQLNGDEVQTRPIKGTRPRSRISEEDKALGEELLSSEKDRAENLMIVDLLRNDLGKVCRIGSVRVPELFGLEGYASVWHLVSTIRGELRPELDAVDLLKACFPGGSITGAPKIRAMEIIEELEPVRRGIYCGAIGYISFTGAMDTSIAIRTLVLKDDRVHLQVGGGIVADSDPEAEYEETLSKG
ncbi:MAG: aminodeoxychorismate synthase component I, partial [Rubrobacteraceae bacterium]